MEPIKIGALWEKEDYRGPFMLGYFMVEDKKVEIAVYLNELKDAPNKPDWLIYLKKK